MKALTILLATITLLTYYCTYIPPTQHVAAALLPFSLPLLLLGNIGFAIFWLFKRSLMLLLPLIVLLIGLRFMQSTIAVPFFKPEEAKENFSILSYNVSFFKKPHLHYFEEDRFASDIPVEVSAMKNWISSHPADIMCFQEYYNDDNSSTYNTIASIAENNEYHYYFSHDKLGVNKAQYGLITFSRFPIVDHGDIFISDNHYNRAIYTDLNINGDTLRLINVHLQSMELRGNNPLNSNNIQSAKSDVMQLYYKLKNGLAHHMSQAETLMNFVKNSPYRVIVSGDFNESPYGYIYQYFRSEMNNAFEKAGTGFGFSYNGNTLFFLRIDHQFFQEGITIQDFETFHRVKFSEHHPIQATYALPIGD